MLYKIVVNKTIFIRSILRKDFIKKIKRQFPNKEIKITKKYFNKNNNFITEERVI